MRMVGAGVQTLRAPALSLSRGLTSDEAELRLGANGPNEVVASEEPAFVSQLLRRFTNPLVAILLVASVASAVVQDFGNAATIIVIVLMSVAVELFQTRRADSAVRALRARVVTSATVLRDGTWRELPRRELVVGDVVRLSAGDMIPADCRVIDARDLHLNEAALTGESVPVERMPGSEVLTGASVVSGTGTAEVIATGGATRFAEIARVLAKHPPPTDYERGIVRFGVFILKTVTFLVLFVFVAAAVAGHNALDALLFAVALAVGLTPEFLPMITTVTLTRGAVRMAKKHVVVKNVAAIQSFGSIDVLCCDKTGTLTTAVMRLEEHVDPFGATSERALLYAALNSYFESGVENPIDAAVLARAKIDPLDAAVLRHEHPDLSGWKKLDEIPFDFERRRTSVVVERGDERLVVTKGAPEQVLAVSASIEIDGVAAPLDAALRARATAVVRDFCSRGLRVLAVAYVRPRTAGAFGKNDERDLVLAGFVAFADPPRPDAHDVVEELRREGVHVKVVTGDSELVAAHVCNAVGISTRHILVGREIDALSDAALGQRAEHTQVFARVTPTQKSRIVAALKSRGHVVGFLGDGINDAPSLHIADVGISVDGATDVAKDAAAIILTEHGLGVLKDGVLEGRRAFGNVMKYLLMGTSSAFGNVFSMAIASVVLPFLPMLPKQILLVSFLYDLAQITIPTDAVDERYVRKPRRWDIGLLRRFMLWIGPISSAYDLLTFAVLLFVFRASETLFHTGWFVESLATQTLVIFIIRTGSNPFRSRPSRALTMTTLTILVLGVLLPFTPVAHWLGFVPLPWTYFAFLVPAVATYLGLVELAKRRLLRKVL
jgi:Mg2+-importing ATPase